MGFDDALYRVDTAPCHQEHLQLSLRNIGEE
jgi:hypothetical protein